MGTEKDLTAILARQISEGGGISSAGLRRTGGTPNHKALARCVGYGWALATPEDRDEGRGRVLEFLRDQKDGHMVFGRTSELGTPVISPGGRTPWPGSGSWRNAQATRRFSRVFAAGLCPSFFAWAEYSTGAERYGARSDWKKNHPGGPRPAEIAVPEAPGEVTETVVMRAERN